MGRRLTSPLNIDLLTWAAQIRNDLPNSTIPILTKYEDWRKWASAIRMYNRHLDVPPPFERDFPEPTGFKLWGLSLINANDK